MFNNTKQRVVDSEEFIRREIDDNMKRCPCPCVGSCEWLGKIGDLEEHYRSDHPKLVIQHPFFEKPCKDREQRKFLLLKTLGFVFVVDVKCDLEENVFLYKISFVGDEKISSIFSYSVNFHSLDTSVLKYEKVHRFSSQEEGIRIKINNLINEFENYDEIHFELR